MRCFDCAALGHPVDAVGICVDCGTGVCADHARVSPRRLTSTMAINRTVRIDPPARTLRCPVCQAAVDTQAGTASATRPRRDHQPA